MSRMRSALLAAAALTAAIPSLAAAQPPGGDAPRGDDRGSRGDGRGWQGAQPAPGAQPGPGTPPPGYQQRAPRDGRYDQGRPDGRFNGDPERRGFDGNRQGGPGADPERRAFDRGPGGPDRRAFDDRRGPGFGDRRGPAGPGLDGRRGSGDRPDYRRDPRYAGGWNGAGGRGWAGPGWRQDRRYDWRGWRDDHRDVFRAGRYVAPRGWGYGYRPFAVGARLQPFFYSRTYWIDDPYDYRLPPAYGSYRWVRYYNDVLLVDLASGAVADVIRDFFW